MLIFIDFIDFVQNNKTYLFLIEMGALAYGLMLHNKLFNPI